MTDATPLDSGTGWDPLLIAASKRSEASLKWAKQLLTDGYSGPALVWAVRSVEIFLKEFVLAAMFVADDPAAGWNRATRKASKLFESLSWKEAFKRIDEAFGPLDKMLSEGGRDAIAIWNKEVVVARHNIVHGRSEASAEEAIWAYQFAEQLITQLKLRLIVAGRHPFSDVFLKIYERARDEYHGRDQSEDVGP